MPKVKPLIREDPRLVRVRADLKYMAEMAQLKTVQISKRTGMNKRTLQRHLQFPEALRIGEVLAWMDTCGAEEIVIRRQEE